MRLTKKRHFADKLKITTMKLWDAEFLLSKVRAEREGIRMERVRTKERLGQTEVKLEAAKDKPDKKIVKSLQKLIKDLRPDVKELEKRMQHLDQWCDGPMVNEQGVDTSIKATIDGLRALIEMLTEYRKKL